MWLVYCEVIEIQYLRDQYYSGSILGLFRLYDFLQSNVNGFLGLVKKEFYREIMMDLVYSKIGFFRKL